MDRPWLSATATGQRWLAQFSPQDRPAATALLNAMLLLNEEQVAVPIRGLLYELAERRGGFRRRVGLYAEREFAEATAFKIMRVADINGRFRRRAVGRAGPAAVQPRRGSPRVGSEGLIAFTISQAVEAWPQIYANQPGPDRIRAKRPIGALAIVTDFIGSGTRVRTLLDKFWAVPSVKAWVSRGWLEFKVVAAAGTSLGIEEVRSHRTNPEVLVEHVVPTIFDAARGNQKAHWLSLISRYGPNPSSVNSTGFLNSGALIAFNYRIPNNTPELLRESANGWRALYDGPAPEELRAAFGLQDPLERARPAATAVGIELNNNLSADEAEMVLVLNTIGSRWFEGEESAIAELTGITVRKLVLIRHDAVRTGILRPDGRLTDAGQATRRAGTRVERQRPTIPTSLEFYYPMQLRVPQSAI